MNTKKPQLTNARADFKSVRPKHNRIKAMIYEKNTIEFVQVAMEFCRLIETTSEDSLSSFADKAVKILPLLYLKATLLPQYCEPDEDSEPEQFITETTYEAIRTHLANLIGEYDAYLETFHPDMQYSDTPIATTISENLADVYQDIGDFAALFRQGNELTMVKALYVCEENFRLYWGRKLLSALKALHPVRFCDDLSINENYNVEDTDDL